MLSLYGELQKILKIKEMVLYDEASFEVEIGNSFQKISQRLLMALSSSDEMGLSWYEARARTQKSNPLSPMVLHTRVWESRSPPSLFYLYH
ncbi:MAG: hypothetical protein CK425_10855 [Parachlamydia sp.]|nr:MAG: hypothetical protein CK425_10855 [Parachlamydia sp.]